MLTGNRGDKLNLGASLECVGEIRERCANAKNLDGDPLNELRKNILPPMLMRKSPKNFAVANAALDEEHERVRELEQECLKKGRYDDEYNNAVYSHDAHNRLLIQIVDQSFDDKLDKKHWAATLTVFNKSL
jgi:hypothetical protein